MRPHSRFRVSRSSPQARGNCDRCNITYTLSDLLYQYQWAGTRLQNLGWRVCPRCMDVPQEQLRAITLPPDPVPVMDPRPEYYGIEITSFLQSEEGPALLTEDGQAIIWSINVTPVPDPENPYLGP